MNRPINLQFDHTYQRLNVAGGTLFTANLSQIRVVYQFNVRMFVRAIIQYLNLTQNQALYTFPVDPETRTVFTQFLFSYKLNPQTVVFCGIFRQQARAAGNRSSSDRSHLFLEARLRLSLLISAFLW